MGIGWFPVQRASAAEDTALAGVFPEQLTAFHWHGDSFDIPEGGRLLCTSEACRNQGFIVDDRVVGLQFHLETTPESAGTLIEHCRPELDGSQYVQSEGEMLADRERFSRINQVMSSVLNRLAGNEL